jgi:hypothetical protein
MEINFNTGQIEIVGPYGRVYLYSHNTANELVNVVSDVLSRQVRWDDPDYLSRMIFCRMIPKNKWDDELGFGIGTQLYTDVNMLITLDTVHQTIKISSAFETYITNSITMSFDDFLNKYADSAEL